METRVSELLRQRILQLLRIWRITARRLPLLVIAVLLGFMGGSLISTTPLSTRWSGSVILALLLLMEALYALYYRKQPPGAREGPLIWFHYGKIGVLWGLFVDAFKVGS
jgi:hypothetical protein